MANLAPEMTPIPKKIDGRIDQNIEALLKSLHPEHGSIVLSGLLLEDWAWVQQRMKTLGLKLVDKRASSAWLALRWKV